MGKIHLLDQSTINQIAAGEVIDRPVSVVKELLENAIDAGSTAVTVEIGQGGISLIRVTDNGGGIDPADLQIAFCRHSTSKISNATDLLSVRSLGFRGEALSSIAAVARVELITRTHTNMIGNRYVIEGGKEIEFTEAGAPEGTTIIVRDLFFNTPARRKFLKTPATEAGYIYDMVCHIALSHPEVSIRYIQNGQSKLHTSGNHNLKDVIYSVYGKEVVRELIPFKYESSFFQVDGFLGKPITARSSRACEVYFINGRFIKSVIIRKAIEEAYRNFLMQHKFPFTVIQITIDSEFTDVNVHPSKMELRFRNQEFLYEELTNAIRKALTEKDLSVAAEFADEKNAKKEEKKELPKRDPSANFLNNYKTPQPADPEADMKVEKKSDGEISKAESDSNVEFVDFVEEKKTPFTFTRESRPEPFESKRLTALIKEESARFEEFEALEATQQTLFDAKILTRDKVSEIELIGQLFDTYWIAQYQDTMLMIDQHAAHEKVNYERIIKELKDRSFTTQQMNPPKIISLTPSSHARFEEISPVLADCGFEVEPFGGNEYAVYGMPDNLVGIAPEDFLQEILENFESDSFTPEAVYEKAASMACKASIKGNQRISDIEAKQLIAQLVDLENPYTCPHGRPVMIRMTKNEIEKKFKRIL